MSRLTAIPIRNRRILILNNDIDVGALKGCNLYGTSISNTAAIGAGGSAPMSTGG